MVKKVIDEEPVAVGGVSPLVVMTSRDLLSTVICGLVVGVMVAALLFVMNKFIFTPVLCRPQAPADCSQAPSYAMVVAMVIGAIAGVVGLARLRIYRPLLVVIAATISLWGLQALMMPLSWYLYVLVPMILFGLAYSLFAWIARLRSFLLALVITVVLVVVIRLVLVA